MARSSMTVEGLDRLRATLLRKAALMNAAVDAATDAEVRSVTEDARSNAPRLTGELAAGIRGGGGEVRSTARHTVFVEFGTHRARAQPFMRPASDRARRSFPARVAAVVRAAVGGG